METMSWFSMYCPEVNKPLKYHFLETWYGFLKTLQVIAHTVLLIYCFSAFDLSEDSLLRFCSLVSLFMLVLNIWSIFMGIVLHVNRKIVCAYETILMVLMVVVYMALIMHLLVYERFSIPENKVQFSSDERRNEKFSEKSEDIETTTQPTKYKIFINDMWQKFTTRELEESLVIPVIVVLLQIPIIVINFNAAFPNAVLESERQCTQHTLIESMEQNTYSRDEEHERRFETKEGEVLSPGTVEAVSETRQEPSSSQPTVPVQKEATFAEKSPAASRGASASEPSSDSEGSSLTQRKGRESKSVTPEPPVEEEKGKIT